MSRYQQVRTTGDDDVHEQPISGYPPYNSHNSDMPTAVPEYNHQIITFTTNTSTTATARHQQQTDLEDTFGESFDEDDDDHHDFNSNTHQAESQRLINPSIHNENRPILSSQQRTQHPAVLPVRLTNDGVFSNMSAKPETEAAKLDETPPAYDIAVADSTPPYWQTTVIAPLGMGDMILVEGLPVGSILGFAWNLLVSASFQYVGFMLTYLLHTSHAAKNGSLAGLGVSLVQTGFYIRSRESLVDDTDLNGDSNDKHKDENTTTDDNVGSLDADILSYILMIIGWFLIIRAVSDYTRAKKMESIIGQEPNPETIV